MEAYTIMPECYKQYTMSTLSSTPKKLYRGMFIFIPKLVRNTFLGNNSLEAEPPSSSVTFAYQHPGDMFGLTEWWMLTSSPQYQPK